MTFIPSVLSIIDNKNTISTSSDSFIGTSSDTTGYNNINVTLTSDQTGNINIQYSDDGITFQTFFSDTYLTENSVYFKSFPVPKRYYKISVNLSSEGNLKVTTRLDTSSGDNIQKVNNQYSNTQEGMIDAFGKLRVSNPLTLLDITIPAYSGTPEYNQNQLLLVYQSTGSYSVTSNPGYLTLNGSGVGKQTNQSQKYITYQPGKSLLFLASGIIQPSGTSSANYIGRIGLFDDNNGTFFECKGDGTISVIVKNGGSDTSISQENWNIDKMDGTGNSGFNLNFLNTQLFIIDLEWLGIGRIRFGFYCFGKIYYCHQIGNVNVLFAPYMATANLPIRYELQGIAGSDTVSITQICSTLISEGGYTELGYPFSYSLETPYTGANTTNWFPIIALSGKNRVGGGIYNHENITPKSLEILDTAQNTTVAFRIRLFFSPVNITLGGVTVLTWSSVSNFSIASIANNIPNPIVPATSFISTSSANTTVYQGYFGGRTVVQFADLAATFNTFVQVASNIDNIADVVVVEIKLISGNNPAVVAALNWDETY